MNPFRYIHFGYMLTGFITCGLMFAKAPFSTAFIFTFIYIYLLPPLLFQLVFRLGFPKFKGDLSQLPVRSFAQNEGFMIWWVSSQLQVHYLRFDFLEELIKWVPGMYSGWLRLWGARVGKNVLWTPRVLIVDRPFIDIGDDVIIGSETRMTSHLANRLSDERQVELFLATIKVGARATCGGGCNLWPGAQVAEGEVVAATANVRNGVLFTKDQNKEQK